MNDIDDGKFRCLALSRSQAASRAFSDGATGVVLCLWDIFCFSVNEVYTYVAAQPVWKWKGTSGLRKTTSQGLVCLILVDELGFFLNMFLRFAVAFLEYSENLDLIRGEKKKRVPENKKHQSETV